MSMNHIWYLGQVSAASLRGHRGIPGGKKCYLEGQGIAKLVTVRAYGPRLSPRPGHRGGGAAGLAGSAGHQTAPSSFAHVPLCLLQAKSSEEMGHWLGLLLSESGSKTDPEEFTYDYVDADRVSCIVSAAKTSLL